jgi:hypothetical protein
MGIQQQLSVLKKLCSSKKQGQRKLLLQGGKSLQHCLRECAINLLSGTVPLSKRQFKKLKKHRNSLRELSKKRTTHKKRIQIEQRGGFLASLLIPVVAAIASATIKKAIHKRR